MKADHITVHNIDEGHLFVCAHCGAAQIVFLPTNMNDWLSASRRFMDAHRHCPPPAVVPEAASAATNNNQ